MSFFRTGTARSRKSLMFMALLLALAVFAAACGGGGDDDEAAAPGDAREGGTVVFGAEQEPANLNGALTAGNLFWTTVTTVIPLRTGTYEVQPDFTFKPDILLEGEAEITEDPFSVTYRLNPDAVWSDGEPITCEDFEFTWKTFVNEKFDIVDRSGFELITDMEAPDERTCTFNFKEPYAPWKTLFSQEFAPIPKHVLEGENFDKVWSNEITLSSGPFEFVEWKKGSQLTLRRNDNYWGEKPKLDEVIFRFVEDTNTEIQQLTGGEVDAIYPQPQLQLSELEQVPDIEIQANAGTVWEHYDFSLDTPGLDQLFVREAIAHGIDRQTVVDQLLRQIAPDLQPLHNVIWMSNAPQYEPHFDKWNFDPAKSEQILQDNGCTKGGDGIFSCDGTKLSFEFVTTAGNELRELQFELIQDQLKKVGIELKAALGSPDVVFGETLPSGNWEIFGFAWVGGPDPGGSTPIFECDGGQNYNSYCNKEVSDLLNEADATIDEERRTELTNQADALMADDLPILPLYQKPTFFAFNSAKVGGMVDNATDQGPTWNIEEWFLQQ